MEEKIAILDCGGQYTKVIDRKVRELGVKSEILPIEADVEKLKDYKALILSGGPSSVYDENAPKYDGNIFDIGLPILGICYGFHLINQHFGGIVRPKIKSEYGQAVIKIDGGCDLFAELGEQEVVLMSHGDSVEKIADGFECTAKTEDTVAAIYNKAKKIAAVQFHPEVELTENGVKIFENFLRKICGLTEVYALEDRIKTSVDMIREKVGNNNVIVFVSGGVDSMVSAALLLKALPADNIYAVHVDHGFMRKNESDSTCENLKKLGFKNLHRINAQDEFLYSKAEIADGVISAPLAEVTEPEQKRQIIGRLFVDVIRKAAESFGLDFDKTFIAQGTLRPDLIESGNPDVSGYANKIKTHHNDVDIIRKARKKGLVIETNWDWHKDEVRQVARMLGIDEAIASRQPFPGPGLAVRLICYPQKVQKNQENQKIMVSVSAAMGGAATDIKGIAAPILSVGVQGDARSYKNLWVMYGGGMNCDFEEVAQNATRITNNSDDINRCVYVLDRNDIDGGALKCSELRMTKDNADLLREIDYIITSNIYREMQEANAPGKVSKYFGVLVPINTSAEQNKYSAVIRAVVTTDFMTARAAVIGKDISVATIKNIVDEIKTKFSEIDFVLYDVTNKPPATVEWE